MARRGLVALAALSLALAPAAQAQTRPELVGPSQRDMNEQAATRLEMANHALNQVYGKLMAAASPDGRNRLRAAQRAWVTFRDLDCDARSGARGGSFHPASVAQCLEAVTDERTRTLQSELDCQEGDMSCGGVR